ncbi:MAG: TIGR04282 family arsenosugar biosynthesis glycosyltransferase [Gemmatimonadetes bacterium]|nr:TIGR04282 family arsenosugar biosynthesis glycosyltransferase [Gemmatimonadota bacterium]
MNATDRLAVFVKAPLAGRVKTRLAVHLGARRAAALYRALGRRVVESCVDPAYPTTVWFSPAAEGRAVRSWMRGLTPKPGFQVQPEGALGTRLAAAFDRHFGDGAERVVIIGSDCPGVDRRLVAQALETLHSRDVVVGPSHDGGYYLIGLRTPTPGLFHEVAWSTPAVLGQTLARVHRLGLGAALLPTLRDVDTIADARAVGLVEGGQVAVSWQVTAPASGSHPG